ncbi:hypothetical protein H7J77_10520 [Mycolicibacillus parakoreensis]|uniref:Uncharacterized protein n=1 Tax=Mycolicibacillus parakoreensis TaxID=1069221 RepID=A0ABY3TYU0_9MYCO|nr:hypothetical protein [Mycolicibacillus parakoreensis]MCV7315972.1 hypothetical protein [Mycolicibacillus parakoreensis]ULN52397.1 hypothetical protein MIU77_16395 [Mycolicibacillus parakoreensis]HLR98938.1 hypothetical protein [Mycolicibacillus parakoreensis]
MSSHPVRVVGAAVLAAGLVVGGCARGGHDDTATSPPSTASTTSSAAPGLGPEAAGPDALPDGFPAAVPILDGQIDAESRDVLGSRGVIWMVTVTDVDPDGAEIAERLLRDAGFVQAEDTSQWSGGPCEREGQFSTEPTDGDVGDPGDAEDAEDSYVVHLCANPDGPRYRLEYTVNVYPPNKWPMPQMPEMPDLPELPEMPEPPAPEVPAPEPPR